MSRLLTKSRLAVARRCPREHKLTFLDGYRPVAEVSAFRFGNLVHGGLEQIYKGEPLSFPADADPWDLAKARPMLRGYQARWSMEDYGILGVEQEFETALVNPATKAESKSWRLGGKLDAVVHERRTGRVLLVEHKTSSQDISMGSPYWAKLKMDSQVSIYWAGAQSLGYDVQGLIYDVLGKPRLRPLQATSKRQKAETPEEFEARVTADIAENPDKYYQRGEVVRLETEMVDAMTDVWQLGQQLREAERLGRAPRNPDACERYGRLCPFFGVCSGSERLDDPALFTQSDDVHPELSGPAKEAVHGSTSEDDARDDREGCDSAVRKDGPEHAHQRTPSPSDQGSLVWPGGRR